MRVLVGITLVTAVAACSLKTKAPTQPTNPYPCLGQALPTTAVDPITVSGTLLEIGLSTAPLPGATVALYATGSGTPLDSGTTDAAGAFTFTLPTGGTPADVYLRFSKSGDLSTYLYPSAPLPASLTRSTSVLTDAVFASIGTEAGVTQTAGNGWIAMIVVDCTGVPISGATVSTVPAGTVRYDDNSGPSSTASATSSDGTAYIFNVAPGSVVVGAAVGTATFRSHTVLALADQITVTAVAPGPTTPPQ